MVKAAITGALEITVMIFFIIAGASAFSQILAFSGATPGLINLAVGVPLPPIFVIIMMQVVVLVMGMFMDPASILMVSIPLFIPIVKALGFSEVELVECGPTAEGRLRGHRRLLEDRDKGAG